MKLAEIQGKLIHWDLMDDKTLLCDELNLKRHYADKFDEFITFHKYGDIYAAWGGNYGPDGKITDVEYIYIRIYPRLETLMYSDFEAGRWIHE